MIVYEGLAQFDIEDAFCNKNEAHGTDKFVRPH